MKLVINIAICFAFLTAFTGVNSSEEHQATTSPKVGMSLINTTGDQLDKGSKGKTKGLPKPIKHAGGIVTKEIGRKR